MTEVKLLRAMKTSLRLEFSSDVASVECYELQWQLVDTTLDDIKEWQTASSALTGPSCVKGGLKPGCAYRFRARARPASQTEWTAIGPPTEPFHTLALENATSPAAPVPSSSSPSPASTGSDAFSLLPPLGTSPLLDGEAAASPKKMALYAPSKTSWLRPEAKMRLVVLYGMGGFAISMKEWLRHAPPWLEVRFRLRA